MKSQSSQLFINFLFIEKKTTAFTKGKIKTHNLCQNNTLPLNDTTMVKYYCLSIALEAKRTDSIDLFQIFKHVSNKKKSGP